MVECAVNRYCSIGLITYHKTVGEIRMVVGWKNDDEWRKEEVMH